jgi:hypothetical protein
MNKVLYKYFYTKIALLILSMICSLQIHAQRNVQLNLIHKVGKEELVLGNSFINSLGEEITVQKFKYYLSNFSVTRKDGKEYTLPENYFLVDEADLNSKQIILSIPDLPYTKIHFLIGVDSIKNVTGIQTGVLDPLKGMFWTWNSGYIMAKLEGTSSASTIAGRSFTYHIGGFKNENNTLRQVELVLGENQNAVTEINLIADINQWFKGKNSIHIAETPVCHTPGKLAIQFADNYANQFSILSVK